MPTIRRDFTNRTQEIERLNQALNSEGFDKDSFVVVHGRTGIGKTQLLAKFLRVCNNNEIYIAYVDLKNLDYRGLIDKIVEDIGSKDFEKLEQVYDEVLDRSQKDKEKSVAERVQEQLESGQGKPSSDRNRGLTFDAPVSAGENQYFYAGPVTYHNPKITQIFNIELTEPIQVKAINEKKITNSFKECLIAIAKERLIAIILDHWEESSDQLKQWLNEHLLSWATDYSLKKALVVLARPDVPSEYTNQTGILPLPVPPFSREAALEFWEKNGLPADEFNALAVEIYSTPKILAIEIDKQRLRQGIQ